MQKEQRKKIGIMGGTFDPIHVGHLILGEKAYEQLGLSKVLFMPSGNPPHKRDRQGRAEDDQRVEMVRLAIKDNPHFQLSLAEMHDKGYTYTYRTLENLKRENPDTDYYFIIGADSLYDFDKWREPARILACCHMVVATRNHTSIRELEEQIDYISHKYSGHLIRLDTLNIDISSNLIRQWLKEGKSIQYYVKNDVLEYIYEHRIYGAKKAEEEEKEEDTMETINAQTLSKMQKKLHKYLDEDRFMHTLGVMYTSASLAMAHGENINSAQVAGLLHDCAKCIPNKKKLKMCSQNHLPVSEFEKNHPFLLHAKLGAYLAEKKYGITDSKILNAITYHTTGRPSMTKLEKIVYIADYIEPLREKAPRLEFVRKLAFQDLDECIYEILKDTLNYLGDQPDKVEKTTREAYQYYRSIHRQRMEEGE